jgi:hypothetical protein
VLGSVRWWLKLESYEEPSIHALKRPSHTYPCPRHHYLHIQMFMACRSTLWLLFVSGQEKYIMTETRVRIASKMLGRPDPKCRDGISSSCKKDGSMIFVKQKYPQVVERKHQLRIQNSSCLYSSTISFPFSFACIVRLVLCF